jgi:hypothetical protein
MTTGLLCTVAVLCLAGAAFCFWQAYRVAAEPMTVGWIHVSPIDNDQRQEAGA